MTTPDEVRERLRVIEATRDVTVLAARDYGSRAWNLDGPDSDRDVAFVFRQPEMAYARLGEYVGSLDFERGGDSYAGWNVRRFAELATGSNPTVVEVLHSDVEYVRGGEPWTSFAAYVGRQFDPAALLGHYRSLAESNYREAVATGDEPTVKRTLYVVRALLYRRWVARTHAAPPLDFPAFVRDHWPPGVDESVRGTVSKLVDAKRRGEGDRRVGNPLRGFVEAELAGGPEAAAHDVRGVERARANGFIDACFDRP